MATTENNYTGNGSTYLYSFTFPYLEEDHIKASLNGVDTTAYSLANATTVSFDTPPANGTAIRIYRETDDEDLMATYRAGSAIRAEDLNDNALQSLYLVQEAKNLAESADASSVAAQAQLALDTANAATVTANAASVTANGIAGTANTALSNSNDAVTTANTANTTATTANTTATTANTTANTALSTANSAVSTANSALTFAQAINPVGAVIWVAMNTAPTGFLKANGAAVSRTTYSALFAAIGTTFGAGNGSTTFNLPDLRGEFIRGWDDSRGVDSGRSFGSNQSGMVGPHNHTITDPGHTHSYTDYYNGNGGGQGGGGANTGTTSTGRTTDSSTTGITIDNNSGTETRPRNVALLACIKF
jgi:hypothetical protein